MKLLTGVYPAMVLDHADPEASGRVRVRVAPPGSPGGGVLEPWARVATLMAGRNRGTWFMPDVDDEVLVAFEAGDPSRAYVIGALWDGTNAPPVTMDAGNTLKVLRSRSGVTITLDDTGGRERFVVSTPGGCTLVLSDGASAVEIADANGNAVNLGTDGVTIESAAKVTIKAGSVELDAAILTVNAAMSKFSGVVQCETLLANDVVSASYSPGAGNIW